MVTGFAGKEANMSKIKILVDTGADLPPEMFEKYDIGLIDFMVNFGDESFVAGKEMTNAQFYDRIRTTGVHPKTAQTPFQDMYDRLLEESKLCDTLIYFTLSGKASGQNNTATLVAKEIMEENPKADIRVVDTKSFSVFIAAAAIYASELLRAGETADTIIEKCSEYVESWEAYLIVDDLGYLEKGGRITKTAAIVGSILDIRPVLTIRDGLIEPIGKLRGKKKIYSKLIEMIKENPEFDNKDPRFMVVHSNEEYAFKMCEAIDEEFGEGRIYMKSEFGPIIGTHTGPGALAVVAAKKPAK